MKTFGLLWHFVNKFSFLPRRTPRPYGEHLVVRFKEDSLGRYKAVSRVTSGRMQAGAVCSSMSMSSTRYIVASTLWNIRNSVPTNSLLQCMGISFDNYRGRTPVLIFWTKCHIPTKALYSRNIAWKFFKVIKISTNFDSMNISNVSKLLVKRDHFQQSPILVWCDIFK